MTLLLDLHYLYARLKKGQKRKQCLRFFLIVIDPISIKLVDYKDIHKILGESVFRPDPTTYCGVSCH